MDSAYRCEPTNAELVALVGHELAQKVPRVRSTRLLLAWKGDGKLRAQLRAAGRQAAGYVRDLQGRRSTKGGCSKNRLFRVGNDALCKMEK